MEHTYTAHRADLLDAINGAVASSHRAIAAPHIFRQGLKTGSRPLSVVWIARANDSFVLIP